MRANYFLFTTLEQARPIAKARNLPEKANPPVLTGNPVAGMVYLDRPTPAGYFIFSDLSVRHEGKYRLSFSLYEQLKDPEDADRPMEGVDSGPDMPVDGCLSYRMDVRSEPFTVFSAKKFPGLSESTNLSRTVAEQGCRVRIRRDVRMKKRDKGGRNGEWDTYEDTTAEQRARMSATPDPRLHTPSHHGYHLIDPVPRPRSASNTSHHSHTPAVSRRPSVQELAQQQQPYAPHPQYANGAPAAPPAGYAPHSVAYSPQAYQAPSFAPPQQQSPMAPPPYQSQSHMVPPAAPQYYPPYQSAPPPPAPQQNYEHRPSLSYPSPAIPEQHHLAQANPPPQHAQAPAPQYASYPPPPPQQQQPMAPPQPAPQPAYAKAPAAPAPRGPPPTTAAGPSRAMYQLPPLHTATSYAALSPDKILEPSSPPGPATSTSNGYPLPPPSTPTPLAEAAAASASHKRAYGKVFHDPHAHRALRNGDRPGTTPVGPTPGVLDGTAANIPLECADDDDDDGEAMMDPLASLGGMHYRRADGRHIHRALPMHS